MRNLRLSPQFVVYLVGGVICALIDIGLMQLLLLSSATPLAATSAGFIAGLLVNYAFHAKVTFKNITSVTTFTRFMCVVLVNYMITVCMVGVAVGLFDAPLVGKLISLPLVAVNGFFLGKHWIFK
jgi:putative flippase GtrA